MKIDTKYIGVFRRRNQGKIHWVAEAMVDGVRIRIGSFYDQKKAAKAYDLYVLKNNLKRKTNFLKKKVVNEV